MYNVFFFFLSSRRRHTRSLRDWSSDVCSSDLPGATGAGSREQAAQQGEVHPAHQGPALVGEGVERAIPEPHLTVDAGGVVPAFIEHSDGVGEQAIAARIPVGAAARVGAEPPAFGAGRALERAPSRGRDRRQRASEDAAGELVPALREREVELAGGTVVQLGGPACTRPAAGREPAVARVEQPLLDQLIEVERGERSRDAERAGRLVAPYLASPLGDVEIKTPPDRFVEQRDDGDLALEIGAWHDKNLHRAQARSNRSNGSVYCAYRSAQARCPTTLTSLSAVA